MKKISFLVILLLYSLHSIGQKIALSDTVSVNLPNRAERLTKAELSSYVNNKFKNAKTASGMIPNPGERTDNRHFYKVDDVLVKLVHGSRRLKNKDNYLAETKKGYDALYESIKDYTKYTSIIKTINNNHVLIMYNELENVGYYTFFCNDSTNARALNGTLQFNPADKDKATKILDSLLAGITFTK